MEKKEKSGHCPQQERPASVQEGNGSSLQKEQVDLRKFSFLAQAYAEAEANERRRQEEERGREQEKEAFPVRKEPPCGTPDPLVPESRAPSATGRVSLGTWLQKIFRFGTGGASSKKVVKNRK